MVGQKKKDKNKQTSNLKLGTFYKLNNNFINRFIDNENNVSCSPMGHISGQLLEK